MLRPAVTKGEETAVAQEPAEPARDDGQDMAEIARKSAMLLLLADVVLRGSSILTRQLVEKNMLKNRYGPEKADDLLARQPRAMIFAAVALSRLATRSVPGAMLVGSGLLAKVLFDRAGTYRKQKRARAKAGGTAGKS